MYERFIYYIIHYKYLIHAILALDSCSIIIAEVEDLDQRTKELNGSYISVTCFEDSHGIKRHYLTRMKNHITFYSKKELFVHNGEPTDQCKFHQ